MNVKKANHLRKTKKPVEEKNHHPPPRVISHELYFPRYGTKKEITPPSQFIIIDGKLLRSAISFDKKKSNRRVKFPENDILVTAYFESVNPWDYIVDEKENSEEEETDGSEESEESEGSEGSEESEGSEDGKSESSSDGSLCEKTEESREESQRSIS